MNTRPRTCSNPAKALVVILCANGAWLFVFGAWAVLSAVARLIGGAL